MPVPRNPVRHLKRYHQIGSTFARHGFGFLWDQLDPAARVRLGRRRTRQAGPALAASAEHFRIALEELGPTFVKLGQVLSTRPDLLPPSYINELTRLQDDVPPAPWEEVREVLTAAYGRPPEEVFVSIDPTPIAAASLAQVHGATLGHGTQVVVKVQRANIRHTIETDLEILADLAGGAQHTPLGRFYDLPAMVEDFANTLRNEMNYHREARNADQFRESFKGMSFVCIPRVYWVYTTERVLVMERISGIKIDNIAAMDAAGVDRKAVALHSAQVIIKEVLEDGFFHADPHAGNFVVMMPGEVFGAMDFGMVGYLSERLRLGLLRLYAAAVEMDATAVVDQLIPLGAVSEEVNRVRLAQDITRLLGKYRGMTLKEIRAKEVLTDISPIAFRHRLRLPTDLWLLGKTLTMMEGMGLQLDPDFDMFAVTEPIVRRTMWRMMMPDRAWTRDMLMTGLDWAEMAALLPKAGAKVLRQAERGELPAMPIKGLDELIRALDRVATRLALSMLIAATMLGTSLLVPLTAGNPMARVLVISGFVISVLMGVWLAFSMGRSFRS